MKDLAVAVECASDNRVEVEGEANDVSCQFRRNNGAATGASGVESFEVFELAWLEGIGVSENAHRGCQLSRELREGECGRSRVVNLDRSTARRLLH